MAARIRTAALAVVLLAGGCNDTVKPVPPPLDRFYFPSSIALRHVPAGCTAGAAGCQTQLLVASSNFDLRYDNVNGGTVIAVDVDRAVPQPGTPAGPFPAGSELGAVQIGSFTGELKLLDSSTCSNWPGPPQVLVTSRSSNELFRIALDDSGALTCGVDCAAPLDATFTDAYGVTLACGSFPPSDATGDLTASPQSLAFVSYLRSPPDSQGYSVGWVTRFDLAAGAADSAVSLGEGPLHTSAFDPATNLLFATTRLAVVGSSPLRWYPLDAPQIGAGSIDLFNFVRGADGTGLALSSDASRLYVAMRIYDADYAASIGGRPSADTGAALLVLDVANLVVGAPVTSTLLDLVRLDRGATEVRVLDRRADGLRDLVAVSSPDEGSVALYDDETGTVARVLALCGDPSAPAPACLPGDPATGKQPAGMAIERYEPSAPSPLAGRKLARLYVASFDRSWVNVITFDPNLPSVAPVEWSRIGAERH